MRRVSNALAAFARTLEEKQKRFFGELGERIGRSPVITIIICVVVTTAVCFGALRLNTHPSEFDIWVPVGSRALKENDFVSSTFGTFRTSFVIAEAKHGNNILEKDILLELMRLQQRIMNSTSYVSGGICARFLPVAACFPLSVLSAWNNDEATLMNDMDILKTVNTAPSISSVTAARNITEIVTGILNGFSSASLAGALLPKNISDLLGSPRTIAGRVVSARALVMMFPETTLELAYGHEDATGNSDRRLTDWEDSLLALVEASPLRHSSLYVMSRHRAPVEGGKAVAGDIKFLASAALLMTAYVLVALTTRWTWATSHVALGLGAISSVLAAICAAFGLGGLLGVQYSELVVAMPFLVLGIGIDDAFVLTGALDRSDPRQDVPSRLRFMMEEAGASILMTSLTDVLAFYVSSFTPLPALSGFCLFAAAAVACDWILQVTLFVAFAALDLRRQNASRMDVFCCYKRAPKNELPSLDDDIASDTELLADEEEQLDMRESAAKLKPTRMHRFCVKYGSALRYKGVKGAILGMWLCLFIVGIWGALHLTSGLSQTALFRDDSSFNTFNEKRDEFFSHRNQDPLDIILPAQNFFNKSVQRDILRLQKAVFASKWVVPGPTSWLQAFLEEYGHEEMDQATFYRKLYLFLLRYPEYLGDIAFSGGFIKATRIKTNGHVVIHSDLKRSTAMTEVRNVCARFTTLKAFPFSFSYPFWEKYQNFIGRNLASFCAVLVAILLTLLLLLGNLGMSLLILFLIVSVDVCMFGVMFVSGTQVSNLSVILLLVSLGLSVDSIAHVAHSFHFAKGTPEQRISIALTQIGASVLKGAFTSTLGVFLLGFASHGVMRLFFKFFTSMFILSVFHGLVLLPVVLSVAGSFQEWRRGKSIDGNSDVDLLVWKTQKAVVE